VAATRIENCACNAGYSSGGIDGGNCTACQPGFAKFRNGSSACEICPRGTFAISGQSVCALCATNTYNNMLNASSCVTCPVRDSVDVTGKFCKAQMKSARGSENVSACTFDVVGIEGVFRVASNLSEFVPVVSRFREGLAYLAAGGDIQAVEILSWRSSEGLSVFLT
jgi:hypothetical protein